MANTRAWLCNMREENEKISSNEMRDDWTHFVMLRDAERRMKSLSNRMFTPEYEMTITIIKTIIYFFNGIAATVYRFNIFSIFFLSFVDRLMQFHRKSNFIRTENVIKTIQNNNKWCEICSDNDERICKINFALRRSDCEQARKKI